MRTILLIDDEQPTLDMLSLFLDAYGYSVITADDGERGLQAFKDERPDIVLTDIKMPGLNGIEVLKRIKELDIATEVIVITGHGDMDLAIQALNLNATDFINKPVQKDALEAALRRAEERLASDRSNENEIGLREKQNVLVMQVHGNVNSRSESSLKDAFNKAIEQGADRILLRFDQNASINGAGIAILTQLLMESSQRGLRIGLAGLSDNFKKVVDVVGITKFARLYDSEDAALDDLGT